jgi:L-amino acid N-acyltransferase YncA
VSRAGAGFSLRDAAPADIPSITRIYAHHVRFGLASFEDEPPDEAEMERRFDDVRARGLPWLVAADADSLLRGYAYAMPYRLRSAYRFTLEDSIYIAPDWLRRGLGRALLARLLESCAAANFRQMVAVIGDSANAASVGLHDRLGFRRVGLLPAVGFKRGRWIDCVLMQRELGDGAATLP